MSKESLEKDNSEEPDFSMFKDYLDQVTEQGNSIPEIRLPEDSTSEDVKEITVPEIKEDNKPEEKSEESVKEIKAEEAEEKQEGMPAVDENSSAEPFIALLSAELGEEPDNELLEKLRSESGGDEVKVLSGYMQEIIKKNSVPQYASELSREFDEAIREGVDPNAYWQTLFSTPDYKNIDLTDADSRRVVIEDYLKETTKLSDAKIEREIARMEALLTDAEDLTEDSEELAEIKEYAEYLHASKEDKKKQMIEKEKQDRVVHLEKVKQLEQNIKEQIKSSDKIAGFDLNEKEKQAFADYLLLKDKTGATAYQRETSNNLKLQLEVAYLTFKKVNKEKITEGLRGGVAMSVLNKLRNYTDKVSDTASAQAPGTNKPGLKPKDEYEELPRLHL